MVLLDSTRSSRALDQSPPSFLSLSHRSWLRSSVVLDRPLHRLSNHRRYASCHVFSKNKKASPSSPLFLAEQNRGNHPGERGRSVNKIPLRKRQRFAGLRLAGLPVRFDRVALRVDAHARHGVVVPHVLLADGPTAPDGFDALAQVVRLHDAVLDRRLRHEQHRCCGHLGRVHGPRNDGLDRRDGGVGVALVGGWEFCVSFATITHEVQADGLRGAVMQKGAKRRLTIIAHEINPLLTTRLGFVPNHAGSQTSRSASLPTSTLPTR